MYPFFFFIISYLGTERNSEKYAIPEHSTRNKSILPLGLGKRSGRPEQWPKMGEKYDLFRKIWPFLGHLDEFGENWIPIWILC